jgi:diguanylate cyclase (GGDEF)-like protein
MVARLGGDEFVIVAEGPQPGLSDLMVRVARAVEEPIASGAGLLRVGTSIGAARFPDDGRTSLALLMHADEAMYAAKQGKRRAPKA